MGSRSLWGVQKWPWTITRRNAPCATRSWAARTMTARAACGAPTWRRGCSVCCKRSYWNVPLSVLGRWCGVHKTTILRWVLGLALALWPLISRWLGERVKASMVYVDEKWFKIRGRWHYWFVVLDVPTELPLLAALL